MADEPRRSGRATKGQHTKNDESNEPEPTKKSKGKGKGKAVKKVQVQVEEEEQEEDEEHDDEEAIIRCICNTQKDIEGMVMVCCDQCDAWQHNVCMGISEVEELLPEHYFCELCRPEDHPALYEAVNKGSNPDQVANKRREDAQKKGKKAKMPPKKPAAKQSKGRAPKSEESIIPVTKTSSKRGSTTPAAESTKKQKVAATPPSIPETHWPRRSSRSSAAAPVAPSGGDETTEKKLKVSIDQTVPVNTLAELKPDQRQGSANRLSKRIAQLVKGFNSRGLYRNPEGETPNSLGEIFALRVEHACFMQYVAYTNEYGKEYKDHTVQIYFNININHDLLLDLLKGELSPDELAVMTSADMQKPELKAQIAAMQEQSDKQNILINEDGPRIRRTHKGEEIVGDQHDHGSSEPVAASFIPRRPSSTISVGSPSVGRAMSPPAHLADTSLDRIRSAIFDINNVWSNVQTSAVDRRVSHPVHHSEPMQTAVAEDPEVDRLLQDNDDDDYYTEYTVEEIAWRGVVDILDGSRRGHWSTFDAQARHIGGADLRYRTPLSALFVPTIMVRGSIPVGEADTYILGTAPAHNYDCSVFDITPQNDDETSQEEFTKLFNLLVPRARVFPIHHEHFPYIREAYLMGLEAGSGETPVFVQRLAHMECAEYRPKPMIIAVFILEWDPPADSGRSTPAQDDVPQGNAVMPGNPYAPPAQNRNDSMPEDSTYDYRQLSHDGAADLADVRPSAPSLDDEQLRLARDILGPWFDAPVPQSIMLANAAKSFGDMRSSLEGIRRLVEKNPAAAHSFEVLQMELALENGMGAGGGGAPQ